MALVKKFKVLLSFTRFADDPLVSFLRSIQNALSGNAAFPNPVVDLVVFKTAIDSYAAAVVQALDGGKQAIATKNKLRGEAIKMAEQLAHYVEANCHGDLQIFTSSAFQLRSTTNAPPQPLPQPGIVRIDQGNTCQLLVSVTKVLKARLYEIRSAPFGTGATAGNWTSTFVPSAQKAAPVSNLTPGTTYTFQLW